MTGPAAEARPFGIPTAGGTVSGLLLDADEPVAMLALAHGAGAGMRHSFMEALAQALARSGVSTLRYQFPYMDRGGGRPDSPTVAAGTVRDAAAAAAGLRPGLPLFVGGKSFGGRMSSTAAADAPLAGVRGIVFFGFPLHPSKQPATRRADHLARVEVPMLFLQGTRDLLADADLMRKVVAGLGSGATLHEIDEADHAFAVPKRTGRSAGDVVEELAGTAAGWMKGGLADTGEP